MADGTVSYEGLSIITPLRLGFAPNNMFSQEDKIQDKVNEIINKVNLLIEITNGKLNQ